MKIHPLLRMTEVSEWVAGNFQPAARSSMSIANVGFSSIGLGWTVIDNYDSQVIPRGITNNLVAGTMAFNLYGVFQVSVGINLDHNETNQGRQTFIRFFNVTDGAQSGGLIPVSIGRNQPGLNFSDSFEAEILAADINKEFRLEIGGGSSITVLDGSVDFAATMTSEWRGFESAEERFA